MLAQAMERFRGLRLLSLRFVTAGDQKVRTAACGCTLVPYPVGNRALRRIRRYVSVDLEPFSALATELVRQSLSIVVIAGPCAVVPTAF
jgi:hypothetical protein